MPALPRNLLLPLRLIADKMKLPLTSAERGRRSLTTGAHRGRAPLAIRVRDNRDFDRVQDTALYKCGCGMVFDAPVTTSVGCPHCGEPQAW
jgi:hypothetical protein